MKKNFSFSWLMLIVVLMVAGCGLRATQRTAINDFAASTAAVGKIASDEVISMRNETINMNRNSLVLAGPDPALPKLVDLDGTFKPDSTLVITKAIDVLKTYGDSLQALSQATQKDEIQKASDNLMTSVAGLSDKYKLSQEEKDAVGKVIVAGGSMIVEEMKEHYIKQIVKKYKDPVNRLANLLVNDFDENYPGSMSSAFVAVAVRSSTYASRAFDQCKDISCREKALGGFESANANVNRSKTVFSDIKISLQKMIKAHETMAQALESNRLSQSDVKDFTSSVKQLIDALRVFTK